LRLQNEGFDIAVREAFLLVGNVPYVDANRTIQRGTLISKLKLSADKTETPDDHVAYWTGSHPCHADGTVIGSIQNPSAPHQLTTTIRADFTFSAKAAYRDYHHKMATYIGRITGEATKIDPAASAQVYLPIPSDEDSGIFKYIDTASSRAGISAINERLVGHRVGIVGLGGSGAYVLDFVAKTKVAEIHIFDADVFSQHNAFRAPGAPTLAQLAAQSLKVEYFQAIYSNMRSGIIAHNIFLDETNLQQMDGLDFVFLCMDRGEQKRAIVDRLVANKTSFIDLGMGVVLSAGRLGGIVRTTTSTPETREQAAPHMSFSDDDGQANEYATNIQIPELNALNASFAVIRWKKAFGLYQDIREDFFSGYSIPSGEIITEGLL
jgi:hypothetical protein